MQNQEAASPEVVVEAPNENSSNELDNLKQIGCEVGEIINGDCNISSCNLLNTLKDASSIPMNTKTKRKARSTRRRLNAMINNSSLHFSDTDSEGELTIPRIPSPNHSAKTALKSVDGNNLLQPVISVTVDGSDDSSYYGERRNSFLENVTDVDEIYTSEPEVNDESEKIKYKRSSVRGSLTVNDNPHQGETELEDMSNDDEEVVQTTIYIRPRTDILCDFNGETITTKEGDGPFSIEVRNQMSIDEAKVISEAPDIVVMPTTDSEDMEASDGDEETEGAFGQRVTYEDFDLMAASQIVMRNVNKMEQLLSVKEPEDAISDSHTDVEDFE